jgi:alkane 1-monooxygenase
MMILCYYFAGWKGAFFFIAQSVVAIFLLEIINYVEHYGLLRQKNSNGSYEAIALHHSWDSRRIISNWFLINLQRHSDHHKYPTRDFTRLRFHDEAPTLPAGYPEMLILALIPPLWFSIMNKRIPQ